MAKKVKNIGKPVWLPYDVIERLESLRSYPRETYGDIIRRVLDRKELRGDG
jgi:hypothetical protein